MMFLLLFLFFTGPLLAPRQLTHPKTSETRPATSPHPTTLIPDIHNYSSFPYKPTFSEPLPVRIPGETVKQYKTRQAKWRQARRVHAIGKIHQKSRDVKKFLDPLLSGKISREDLACIREILINKYPLKDKSSYGAHNVPMMIVDIIEFLRPTGVFFVNLMHESIAMQRILMALNPSHWREILLITESPTSKFRDENEWGHSNFWKTRTEDEVAFWRKCEECKKDLSSKLHQLRSAITWNELQ